MDRLLRDAINACFSNPQQTLGGTSEVNCQCKMVFLTFWELGWDPVRQLFLNFQIAKEYMKKTLRQASAAADIVAAGPEGIYLVCEVKYWDSPSLATSVGQVREYQEALNAPRACLTNGRRWMIFDKDRESPLFDRTFLNVDEMLTGIKDWIGPPAINTPSPYPYQEAFELGISITKRRRSNMGSGQKQNPSGSTGDGTFFSDLLITKRDKPEVHEAVTLFLKLIDEMKNKIPGLTTNISKSNRYCISYYNNPEPILEIGADGLISGKSPERMVFIYKKESLREPAKELKAEIERIRKPKKPIKSQSDAKRLALKLAALLSSFS